ncbi:MAG: chemotaxis protein [Lachnospiraceae bacterium]|nr:chemotaxis protein [Lachnospiraceae bacterium]
MSLEQKHMLENNRTVMSLGVIIQVFMMAATILYAGDRNLTFTIVMVVVEALCIAIMIVGYILLGKNEKGHYPMLLSLAVGYLTMLVGSGETPYLYAFGVLIGIAVVAYNSTKICRIACATAIIENIIFMIIYYVSGAAADVESVFMVPTNLAFVVLFSLMCYLVVRRNDAQIGETMDDIERRAKEQTESAEHIQETSAKIREKLEDANVAMESLNNKVQASATAVEQISSSVTMTAEAIQTQTEMNSNITESLENISEESKQMLELSNDVRDNVSEGRDIIANLEKQAVDTAHINEETAEMTTRLAESAETVKDIVNTILGISSQTNLLALNASIEAARAGEAGKGFAVVADEIRQLSENTKQSAEQISSTIDELIDRVSLASDNMNKSVQSSNKQGDLIRETGDKFAVILESVKTLSTSVEEISANVNSCVDANTSVMDAITNLSATSEEVAASSESSLTLSNECAHDVNDTNDILDEILGLARSQIQS